MADDNRLAAETRTEFGKGAARKIRAADKIPAVLYGHGSEPRHLTLPGHETSLILRRANALLDLDIEGASQLALVKDVQKDPVRQLIEHIDLVIVRRGERVTVDVPVHVEGESAVGTIATLDQTTVSVEVEATQIPDRIVLALDGEEAGTQITAGQLSLPGGAKLASDPELLVLGVTVPAAEVAAEETEGEGDEAEAAEEGAESAADAGAEGETPAE